MYPIPWYINNNMQLLVLAFFSLFFPGCEGYMFVEFKEEKNTGTLQMKTCKH